MSSVALRPMSKEASAPVTPRMSFTLHHTNFTGKPYFFAIDEYQAAPRGTISIHRHGDTWSDARKLFSRMTVLVWFFEKRLMYPQIFQYNLLVQMLETELQTPRSPEEEKFVFYTAARVLAQFEQERKTMEAADAAEIARKAEVAQNELLQRYGLLAIDPPPAQ